MSEYNRYNQDSEIDIAKIGKFFILVVIPIVIVSLLVTNHINTSKLQKAEMQKYKDEVAQLFDEYNISDIEIELSRTRGTREFDCYHVMVYSDKFNELTNEDKLYLLKAFESIKTDTSNKILVYGSTAKVYSNNVNYEYEYYEDTCIDGLLVNGERKHWERDIEKSKMSDVEKKNDYTITPSDDEKAFAWVIATERVKEKLKSPSSAEFPFSYGGEDIMKNGENIIRVNSYVNAQNSFGAMIRTDFTVIIQIKGDKYQVLSVELYE